MRCQKCVIENWTLQR